MTPDNAQKCFEGRKTQTRRLVRYLPAVGEPDDWCPRIHEPRFAAIMGDYRQLCPFGELGSRLWVRERGWERPERTPQRLREGADTQEPFYYDALLITGEAEELKRWGFKRRPSIHMPGWACRTVLEITAIRVERLQDISEGDAMAEGCAACGHTSFHVDEYTCSFKTLWASIHGIGTWAENPWVWVIAFRRVVGCGR